MTKQEHMLILDAAIVKEQAKREELEANLSDPNERREYDKTLGRIEAYKECFHLLAGSKI